MLCTYFAIIHSKTTTKSVFYVQYFLPFLGEEKQKKETQILVLGQQKCSAQLYFLREKWVMLAVYSNDCMSLHNDVNTGRIVFFFSEKVHRNKDSLTK